MRPPHRGDQDQEVPGARPQAQVPQVPGARVRVRAARRPLRLRRARPLRLPPAAAPTPLRLLLGATAGLLQCTPQPYITVQQTE